MVMIEGKGWVAICEDDNVTITTSDKEKVTYDASIIDISDVRIYLTAHMNQEPYYIVSALERMAEDCIVRKFFSELKSSPLSGDEHKEWLRLVFNVVKGSTSIATIVKTLNDTSYISCKKAWLSDLITPYLK